ncbi:MAG TPA: hypothetical protein DEF47_14630 [Herpetosiphon sp.]|nr:hypothetical protein [Herpetosiphon sp.]
MVSGSSREVKVNQKSEIKRQKDKGSRIQGLAARFNAEAQRLNDEIEPRRAQRTAKIHYFVFCVAQHALLIE